MGYQKIFDRRGLLLLLSLLLTAGFFATTLLGYQVSKRAIRDAIIGQDLPLTSSNIYSEIQKDLVRPVLISSTMASDTFLRDWVLKGELGVGEMARYLSEVKQRYGAFSSFFVSEKSAIYYTGEGMLKRVAPGEPRDAWYYRVRDMKEAYEINVDPDLANRDALTIFINYRVFDFDGNYIGATGIGLTVDAVRRLIAEYQQRFQRTIYFVDAAGQVVVFGNQLDRAADLRAAEGLGPLVERILQEKSGSYQYQAGGDNHILNVNYLPELKWYLFVEQNEEVALAGIRRTLYVNLAISLAVTLVVVLLTHLALSRYQHRIEEMASTDKLTGLLNRHAFIILVDKLMAAYRCAGAARNSCWCCRAAISRRPRASPKTCARPWRRRGLRDRIKASASASASASSTASRPPTRRSIVLTARSTRPSTAAATASASHPPPRRGRPTAAADGLG